jgi:endogenous inhibitor of DNA gyrase (YacG/DUF329 family)
MKCGRKKGYVMSLEERKKCSERAKKLGFGKWMTGKKASPEAVQKMKDVAKAKGFGLWMNGKTQSPETKAKISLSHKGITPSNFVEMQKKGWIANLKENISYGSLHDWVKYHKPKPKCCEECNTKRKLALSSTNHTYERDITKWRWLCYSCHTKIDNELRGKMKEEKLNKKVENTEVKKFV